MKKSFKYYLIIWIVSVVIFNIISFVVAANTSISIYWPAYSFIMLSFIGQVACAYIVYKSDSNEKIFLNIPLFHICNTCLILTVISVGLCTIFSFIPNWFGVTCALLILLYNVIAVIATIATENKISEVGHSNVQNTNFMKEALSKLEVVMANNKDDKINKLYDLLRYADPVSNKESNEIEKRILEHISKINDDASMIDLLFSEVEERKALVKKGK